MSLLVRDVAQLLAVSEKAIYRWVKQGIVPGYKVLEGYRFNLTELLEMVTSRRMGRVPDAYSEQCTGLLETGLKP